MSEAGIESEISGSLKHFGEIRSRRFDIMIGGGREGNLRDEERSHTFLPLTGAGRRTQSSSALHNGEETSGKNIVTHTVGRNDEIGGVNRSMSASCIPSLSVAATEISTRECHSRPEIKFQKPEEQVKLHAFFGESSFAVSKSSQVNSPRPMSGNAPYRSSSGSNKFVSGQGAVSSFMEPPILSLNDQYPKVLELGKSLSPSFKQNIVSLFLNDPSTSEHKSPDFGGMHQKLQNCFGFRQLEFPDQSYPPELTISKMLQRLPRPAHDVETMRIHTSIDSFVGLSGGYPGFSQTTHSLLIAKRTDVTLGKENEVAKKFGVASEVNGNPKLDGHGTSPFFSYRERGVKIQSLGSYTDSEGKENAKVVMRNESSAETDIMDMDDFMEKRQYSGVNSTSSNKGVKMDSRPSQLSDDSSGINIEHQQVNTNLPDMNLEYCPLSAGGNSKDGTEPSSSKTQSLDLDLLLRRAEGTNYCISNPIPDNSHKTDPTERWIKRLKFSTSDSQGRGMQTSLMEEFSRKTVNRLLNTTTSEPGGGNRLLNTTTSEPGGGNRLDKEFTEAGKGPSSLRNIESSYMAPTKNSRDSLLSQPWIQRWRHNEARSTQQETQALLLYEPQVSKPAMDDFQQNNFPSIAAMALMGKAMNGFQPCQIEKKGSFVLWNTKEV